jgi:hypothetical protein
MQVNSTAVLRPDLNDAVLEYAQALNSQYMGLQLLPIMDSDVRNASFAKIAVSEVTKPVGDLKRSATASYDRVVTEVTSDTFDCEEYGIEELIDDGESNFISNYFDAETATAQLLVHRAMRTQEKRIATLLFNATTFAGYTGSVTNEWDDKTNATPFDDISDTILTLKQNVGGVVEGEICLAVSEKVFRNIYETDQIKALRRGGNGASIDRLAPDHAELARILNVAQVYSSPSQDNGADIWDDEYALLYIRSTAGSASLRSQIQLGRSFLWTQDTPDNMVMETYRAEDRRSNVLRARQYIDEKVLTVQAGYLLSNITA